MPRMLTDRSRSTGPASSTCAMRGSSSSKAMRPSMRASAEAEVLAVAERDVAARVARRTKLVGVGTEDLLVPIRRGVEQQQAIAFANLLPAERGVARRRAHEAPDRGAPAQHLLDGPRQLARVARQRLALVGPGGEREHAVREEVPRRLVPGHEQRQAEHEQVPFLYSSTSCVGRRATDPHSVRNAPCRPGECRRRGRRARSAPHAGGPSAAAGRRLRASRDPGSARAGAGSSAGYPAA